jgi:hypothetical protein
MLHRRHFVMASAALACVGGRRARAAERPGVPASGRLAFQVSRNGSEIGTHTLAFVRNGDTLSVHIDAKFRVHFGPITFYRYHHQGVEQWRNGAFASLETSTDDNGSRFAVHAARTANHVLIRATGMADQMAPADALPLTHWALETTQAALFNPETGKLLQETLQTRGPSTVALANGTRIAATRVALGGIAPIEDFYDSDRVWAALDAIGKDGSHISYRRV